MNQDESYAFKVLLAFCRYHSLNFTIHYSECDSSWSLEATGASVDENFYIRKAGALYSAVEYFFDQARILYGGRFGDFS